MSTTAPNPLVDEIANLLEGLTVEEVGAVVDQVLRQISYGHPILKAVDIEKRNYTLVTVHEGYDAEGEALDFNSAFLVPSKKKAEALRYIQLYFKERGWTVPENYRGTENSNVHLYPGNYVTKARKLYAEGKYLGGGS